MSRTINIRVSIDAEVPALDLDNDADDTVYAANIERLDRIMVHAVAMLRALPDSVISVSDWEIEDYGIWYEPSSFKLRAVECPHPPDKRDDIDGKRAVCADCGTIITEETQP